MSRLDDEEFAVKAPYIQQIFELQADNERLRDVLQYVDDAYCFTNDTRVSDILANTPAQSLQAIKDTVIEQVADRLTSTYWGGAYYGYIVRTMKGKI